MKSLNAMSFLLFVSSFISRSRFVSLLLCVNHLIPLFNSKRNFWLIYFQTLVNGMVKFCFDRELNGGDEEIQVSRIIIY